MRRDPGNFLMYVNAFEYDPNCFRGIKYQLNIDLLYNVGRAYSGYIVFFYDDMFF